MKPAPFEYFAPDSVEETLEILARSDGAAKVLAGGQSLVPAMNFRLAAPSQLVDINGVEELFGIDDDSQRLVIHAMTRQRAVERSEAVRQLSPLICETLRFVAHPQIRNRGTFGGSTAHADPAAEVPAVLLALDARIVIASQRGERAVAASDFFVSLFETALESDELLVRVEIDAQHEHEGTAFEEVARRSGDYALAGVCARVRVDPGSGQCVLARIAFLSVGDLPLRAREAEAMLEGSVLTEELIASAAQHAAAQEIQPSSDLHASADFRRSLAAHLTQRVVRRALGRASSQPSLAEESSR